MLCLFCLSAVCKLKKSWGGDYANRNSPLFFCRSEERQSIVRFSLKMRFQSQSQNRNGRNCMS